MTELAWILSTVAPMGLLERAHFLQGQGRARTAGFGRALCLSGPDGGRYSDLRQRRGAGRARPETASRITRDLAIKINETFGEILKLPEPRIHAKTADGAGPRRPEDEQELRQHDRHFRRRKRDAEAGHEHRDRFDAGRGAEGSGCVVDRSALLASRDAGGSGGDGRGFRARRDWLRRFQEATFRASSGSFSRRCGNGGRRFSPSPVTSTKC